MGWLNAAKANGLKVVGILGPNRNYADMYDPVAMSNLAAWITKTGLVTAFEVTNEPNNAYQSYEGPTWKTKLVTLTNAVANAILYAISQPDDVDVNEMIIRTVRSAGHAF